MLRILSTVKPYWKQVLAFVVAVAAVSGLGSYNTYLGKLIIDQGIGHGDRAALVNILVQFIIIILVQAVGVLVFIFITGTIGQKGQYDLRKRVFNTLQSLSLSYFYRTPVG